MQMVKDHDRQVAEGEDKGEELLALYGDSRASRSTRLEVLIQRVKENLLRVEEEEEVAKKMVTETRQQASRIKCCSFIILQGLRGRALSFCNRGCLIVEARLIDKFFLVVCVLIHRPCNGRTRLIVIPLTRSSHLTVLLHWWGPSWSLS